MFDNPVNKVKFNFTKTFFPFLNHFKVLEKRKSNQNDLFVKNDFIKQLNEINVQIISIKISEIFVENR